MATTARDAVAVCSGTLRLRHPASTRSCRSFPKSALRPRRTPAACRRISSRR